MPNIIPSRAQVSSVTPQDGQLLFMQMKGLGSLDFLANFQFQVNPEELQIQIPSRVTTVNTIAGAYQDNWGPGVGRLSISGTSAYVGKLKPFLNLSAPQKGQDYDGYLSFLTMRDFHRAYQDLCAENDPQFVELEILIPPRGPGQLQFPSVSLDPTQTVYGNQLGYYRISSDNFTILRSKAQPLLFRYQWDMTILHDYLELKVVDPSKRFILSPGQYATDDPFQTTFNPTGGTGTTTPEGISTVPFPTGVSNPGVITHAAAASKAKAAVDASGSTTTPQKAIIPTLSSVDAFASHTIVAGHTLTVDEINNFAGAYGLPLPTPGRLVTNIIVYIPTEAWLNVYRQYVPNLG